MLENHETNNTYATLITVGADLVVSAMSVLTDGAGIAITVSATEEPGRRDCGSTATYYLPRMPRSDSPMSCPEAARSLALASGASDPG